MNLSDMYLKKRELEKKLKKLISKKRELEYDLISLDDELILAEKDIVIYGESLGTGVATEIAQNSNFAGLVLETPFTSMIDAAKNFYPYIPVSLLLKDKYDNKKKIKNINIPVLVMHGEVDQIVPFRMGEKIYEIANQPKYSYFTKFDDHMMEYDENLLFALKTFIKSLN